jgi:glycerol-3-phosphate dehydrogenase subunit C
MAAAERSITYAPTDGLTYDPSEPRYWDETALSKEVSRVFEICHGCRMCFKYCDSFPTLFDLIDHSHEGDVRALSAAETGRVMDACFQCKLCEVQCPYTPRDHHAFQLDFPRLVHRFKAVRARKIGFSWRDRVLADPDRAGRMARASGGLANALSRVRIHRWFLEKALGIHRDKDLPAFASTTFERWTEREGRIAAEPGGEAVLFPTCYVQNNEPQLGRDTLEVLEKNGVDVRCARGLQCCGMPAWERGDLASLRARARANLDVLTPFVERGTKVVAINPTCSMMMRREWPSLLEGRDRERAARLAKGLVDPSELLWSIRAEPRFCTEVKSRPSGKIACHAPCHLRAQSIGFRARDLFKKLFGAEVSLVSECCGHDGTFAMTVEGFEASRRIGAKAFGEMKSTGAELWSTDCPLAALQFRQHAGVLPLHPMTILARAYRGDPFPGPAGALS